MRYFDPALDKSELMFAEMIFSSIYRENADKTQLIEKDNILQLAQMNVWNEFVPVTVNKDNIEEKKLLINVEVVMDSDWFL